MQLWEKPFLMQSNPVDYLLPGGTMINDFLGRDSSSGNQPSQLWVASVVQSALDGARDSRSRLAPPNDSLCLAELLTSQPADYMGEHHAATVGNSTGMLLKLLNTNQRLLVQAHPSRQQAMHYFGIPFGKTEAWYVLKTQGDAAVYVGFRQGVTREAFQRLIEQQDTAAILDCLHRFTIKSGDVICIPAGLPHAMGENSLVAEIQEPTDITLRAERFRPDGTELPEVSLHSGIGVEAMLNCFDFTTRSHEATREQFFVNPVAINDSEVALIPDSYAPFFGMNCISVVDSYHKQNTAFLSGLVLEGEGTLCAGDTELAIRKGTEFFVPAGVTDYSYHAAKPLRILECYPPKR